MLLLDPRSLAESRSIGGPSLDLIQYQIFGSRAGSVGPYFLWLNVITN